MATATRRVVRTMPQMFIDVADNQSERLQVAAYARVSTEKEEQEDSFERQVEHYKQLIYSKPEWQFVDVYADATVIIGLKQNPTHGRRFSPIFFA